MIGVGDNDNHEIAPGFAVSIDSPEPDPALSEDIMSLEYEFAADLLDVCTLTIVNSKDGETYRHAATFAMGQEINVWGGYDNDFRFFGRMVVTKVRPLYPDSGVPTIEVIAYTKEDAMKRNGPTKSADIKRTGRSGGSRKRKKQKKDRARTFAPSMTYAQIVEEVAKSYDFELDIDPTPDHRSEADKKIIQKVGLKDFDLVAGLSNLVGYLFWVDGDESGKWTLHFKDPNTTALQDREVKLTYNGLDGTLKNFDGQQELTGGQTSVSIQKTDPRTGERVTVTIEPNGQIEITAADLLDRNETTLIPGDILVAAEGVAHAVLTNHALDTEKQMRAFAKRWIQESQSRYFAARWETIGMPDVRAYWVVNLSGMGDPWDGDYYVLSVRHKFDVRPYTCEWTGRKVVKELEILE